MSACFTSAERIARIYADPVRHANADTDGNANCNPAAYFHAQGAPDPASSPVKKIGKRRLTQTPYNVVAGVADPGREARVLRLASTGTLQPEAARNDETVKTC